MLSDTRSHPTVSAPNATLPAGGDTAQNLNMLQVALGLEQQAIDTYQLDVGSTPRPKLLSDVAALSQGRHKGRQDALIAMIQKPSSTPVMEKKLGKYAQSLKTNTLNPQPHAPDLATGHNTGAINAYSSIAYALKDVALVQAGRHSETNQTMRRTTH